MSRTQASKVKDAWRKCTPEEQAALREWFDNPDAPDPAKVSQAQKPLNGIIPAATSMVPRRQLQELDDYHIDIRQKEYRLGQIIGKLDQYITVIDTSAAGYSPRLLCETQGDDIIIEKMGGLLATLKSASSALGEHVPKAVIHDITIRMQGVENIVNGVDKGETLRAIAKDRPGIGLIASAYEGRPKQGPPALDATRRYWEYAQTYKYEAGRTWKNAAITLRNDLHNQRAYGTISDIDVGLLSDLENARHGEWKRNPLKSGHGNYDRHH